MSTVDTEIIERLARLETTLLSLVDQFGRLADLTENVARMQERQDQHHDSIDVLFSQTRSAENVARNASANVDKWVNRGIGAYVIAGALLLLIGYFVLRMVDQYDGQLSATREQLITLDRRLAWLEFEVKGRDAYGGDK